MRFNVYRTPNVAPLIQPFEKLMSLEQDDMDDATDEFIATMGEPDVEIDCIHRSVTLLTTDVYIYQVVEVGCEEYMASPEDFS